MERPAHFVESRAVTLARADASAVDAASQLCDSLASLDAVADALFAGLRVRGDSQRGRLEVLWARLRSAQQRVDAIAALSQRATRVLWLPRYPAQASAVDGAVLFSPELPHAGAGGEVEQATKQPLRPLPPLADDASLVELRRCLVAAQDAASAAKVAQADSLISATAALCAAEPQPYAYVLQACSGMRSQKARAAAQPDGEGVLQSKQHAAAGELPMAPASMVADDMHTPAFGTLDSDGFGFRPAPAVAPDFASLPSVLPHLPAVANLSWQAVGSATGAQIDAAGLPSALDGSLDSAPNLWGALLPAVAPAAAAAAPVPPPLPPSLPPPLPPMPPQAPPAIASPMPPALSADTDGSAADEDAGASSTTHSAAPQSIAAAAKPAAGGRAALLAALQTDNPLARLKKKGTAAPPRPPPPAAVPSADDGTAGPGSTPPEQPAPPPMAASMTSDPHSSLMSAILSGPKLRSPAERKPTAPRPAVVETPREALLEAIKSSGAARLRSAAQPAAGAQPPQRAAPPANDVMTDLASSIMRRRASIEPQDDDDDDDNDGLGTRGESRVLGLRAYLASKESSAPADAHDDWE